jgi:hypothetical protein
MPNHPVVWHSGVTGGGKKRSRAAIGASALTAAVFLPAAMPTAVATPTVPAAAGSPSKPSAGPALSIVKVKVVDPGTIDTTFSNPMDPTKLKVEQFQAPHYYWVIPHTHIAVAFRMLDGNRTVRTVLDRGLHPTKGRCEGASISNNDPRCATDTLEWEVDGATDMYGQTIQNNEWKVWTPDVPGAVGAIKHPEACRPGCP